MRMLRLRCLYSQKIQRLIVLLGVMSLALSAGCGGQVTASEATAQSSPTPSPSATIPAPTAIPMTTLYLSPELPHGFVNAIRYPQNWVRTDQPEAAHFTIGIGTQNPQAKLIYALAAPFNTIRDQISLPELQALWHGTPTTQESSSTLLVSPETLRVFEKFWGPASEQVQVLDEKQIAPQAWSNENTWAILPFDALEPQWKVLEIDGQSPLHKQFVEGDYPLAVPISLSVHEGSNPDEMDLIFIPPTNRDSELLTTVVLTGVTALVRATASMMELRSLTYPAEDIRDILREADITHINNEVPFTPACPKPGAATASLVFCSRPEYIELLEDIGTDVIELDGDHFQDWGEDAIRFTIDMYNQRGWPYYGGGENLADAQKPALFESNGTKIAFLGCNAKPPGYAGASETTPGAMHCDMDRMAAQVRELRQQGYLPIVTFQHLEYYSYHIHPILQADFEKMADAGAVIVSGSQAHQPHGIALYKDSFLHYGLGNLFFDQYNESLETRQAFIDRHIFYDGKHIATELLTIAFTDYAHSQPMSLEDRQALLEIVFNASQW